MIKNNITGEVAEWIGRGTYLKEIYYIVRMKDGKKEKWLESDCKIIKMTTQEMG